jgi:protein-tyrosine phosphatase
MQSRRGAPVQLDYVFQGCLNLRDLGGHRTADGRRVKHGCLFRSDELCALTDADVNAITALGIRVVFDLRNDHERSSRPNRLPDGIEVLERSSPSSGGRSLEQAIVAGDLPEADDIEMGQVYVDLLVRLAPELRTILARAAEAPQRPLLFHCAAGKDRTGVTAAVLLGLLGVDDEVILDDYEETTAQSSLRRLDALRPLLVEYRIDEHRVHVLLKARRPVLAYALTHLHSQWGDFETYAREVLGIAADLPARLRDVLLR